MHSERKKNDVTAQLHPNYLNLTHQEQNKFYHFFSLSKCAKYGMDSSHFLAKMIANNCNCNCFKVNEHNNTIVKMHKPTDYDAESNRTDINRSKTVKTVGSPQKNEETNNNTTKIANLYILMSQSNKKTSKCGTTYLTPCL